MANDLQLMKCMPSVEYMPLVDCMPLWDPPELQQFICKLTEIRLLFLEKLDYLSYALSDTHPSQEATKLLQDTRKLARNAVRKLSHPILEGTDITEKYLDFLDTLQRKGDLHGPLDIVLCHCAKRAWDTTQYVQQGMVVFRGELGSAICRITTAQMGGENGDVLKSPLFAIDNIKVIAELFDVIDECNELLQPWSDYFLNMACQILNRNPRHSDPPSEEEIRAMEGKWKTFHDATESYPIMEWVYLEMRIQKLPRDYGRPRFWRKVCKFLRRGVSVKPLGQSISYDDVMMYLT